MKRVDLEPGMMFGRLTTIAKIDEVVDTTGRRQPMWECKCICGKSVVTRARYLREGKSKSCGCFKVDNMGTLHSRTTRRKPCSAKSPPPNVAARFYNPSDMRYGR